MQFVFLFLICFSLKEISSICSGFCSEKEDMKTKIAGFYKSCEFWGGNRNKHNFLVFQAVFLGITFFQVCGFIGLLDIKLSAIPVIVLIMSIGVSMEYTVHSVLVRLHHLIICLLALLSLQ